jgi:radical SAM superfamily enzyme YgiQ (UPF0313 family)
MFNVNPLKPALKKIKLLLLQPPVQDFYETDLRLQPIGLCYIKSAIKKYLPETEVVIKDYHKGWGRRTLPIPKELSYLKDFFPWPDKGPFSSFHQYYHFGAPFDVIGSEIARERPDMVGISSLFSPYYMETLRSAEEIKKRLNIPVIVGGSHVSAMPRLMLAHPSVDFAIRGEGERPMVEFLKAWLNGKNFRRVPNLCYKENGKLVFNPVEENFPLEDLPFPDLSDLPAGRYLYENRPLCFLVSSRGCPHRCSFCSIHLTFGREYRRRSTENVLREIRQRYMEGYRVFDFEDDALAYKRDGLKELCEKLADAFPDGDVLFTAMNGISYFHLDPGLLRAMKKAGFRHLNLSLVGLDKVLQKTTGRPHSPEKYLEVVEEAHRLGFQIVSYQIIGLPGEDLDSMIGGLALGSRLPVLLGPSLFYLPPKSSMAGNFPDPTPLDMIKSRLTAMAVETDLFKREDLYTLFITARIVNFLKGLKFQGDSISLREAMEIARQEGGRSGIGAEILKKLFEERRLFASTKEGLKPLTRFKEALFFRAWREIEFIKTQEGKKIGLEEMLPS